MGTLRCSHQNHSNLRIGNRKLPPVATKPQLALIHSAMEALEKARKATSKGELDYQLSEAFRQTRNCITLSNN